DVPGELPLDRDGGGRRRPRARRQSARPHAEAAGAARGGRAIASRRSIGQVGRPAMPPLETSAAPALAPIRPDIEAMEDSRIVEVWKLGFSIPDVIGLWVGEGDLPTPAFICDEVAAALGRGETFYAQKRGIPELRQALIDYHRRIYGVTLADDRI